MKGPLVRGHYEPSAPALFGGTDHHERWTNHASQHQQPCRRGHGSETFDDFDPVFNRTFQYGGAVGRS